MAVALVGRGTEQAELTSTWQAARGGQARVVGLAGPAGIGKTALVGSSARCRAGAAGVGERGAGGAHPVLGRARPGGVRSPPGPAARPAAGMGRARP